MNDKNILEMCNEESLYLHNQNLFKIPVNFCKFSNISQLYLQNNCLSSLEGLEQLPLLQVLDVSHNYLRIIDGLQHCHFLEKLNIERQYQSHLTQEIKFDPRTSSTLKKCLINLNCSGNNLDEISELIKFGNVKFLDLNSNKLSNLVKLSKDLSKLKYLVQLNLKNNCVTRRVNYMRDIIGVLPSIEELDGKMILPNIRRIFLLKINRISSGKPKTKTNMIVRNISKKCKSLSAGLSQAIIEDVQLRQKLNEDLSFNKC